MSVWQVALFGAMAIAFFGSGDLPRARAWILLIGLAFSFPTAWARLYLAETPFINILSDATICLAIYFFAKEEWELRLYNIFQISIALSLLYMAVDLFNLEFLSISHKAYITALELCNWAALAMIGTVAAVEGVDDAFLPRWRHYFRMPRASLRAPRTKAPFYKVKD